LNSENLKSDILLIDDFQFVYKSISIFLYLVIKFN